MDRVKQIRAYAEIARRFANASNPKRVIEMQENESGVYVPKVADPFAEKLGQIEKIVALIREGTKWHIR